jgi:uncharacterized SAM-binding protein YcdF (DUF218 family)
MIRMGRLLRRNRRILGLGAVVLVAAWLAGLVGFFRLADRSTPIPPHADGIVALTGGADRVETALRLLAGHRADWLLLSGIGGGVELSVLARRAGVDPAPLTGRVRLGRQATSTRGNAEETATWVRDKRIRSLIVVTAWYHMPRAMTELRRALPEVALYPAPVEPEGSRALTPAVAHLVIGEYMKYLAAVVDLTALVPEREPVPMRSARPE